MGMDGVEMVMAVEGQFGITIADAEAEAVRTPGMLIDLVMAKVTTAGREVCRSQRGFYLTRRFLVERCGVARETVTLNAVIRQFMKEDEEREFWEGLRGSLGAKRWPKLEFSEVFSNALALVFLGIFGATTYLLWSPLDGSAIVAGAAIAFLTGIAATTGLARFKRFLPARVKTIRDVAMVVAGVIEAGKWHRAEVAVMVEKIIVEVLGLAEGIYREDADFVKELGLN